MNRPERNALLGAALLLAVLVPPHASAGGRADPAAAELATVRALARARTAAEAGETCRALVTLGDALSPRPPRAARARLTAAARKLDADWEYTLPHCRIRESIRALQTAAADGAPRTVTLDVKSTVGWGCPCPPFVQTASDDTSLFDEEMFYVVGPSGAKPAGATPAQATPPDSIVGVLKLTGRFRAESIDRHRWHAMTGRRPLSRAGDRAASYARRHPLFEVDSWCLLRVDPAYARDFPDEVRNLPRCR